MTMTLPSFDKAICSKTYSQARGWRGKCAVAHQEAAAKARGYSYSEDDVSDSYVKRQYNVLVKNLERVEYVGVFLGVASYVFTKDNGNHVVVYFKID